MNKSCIPLLLMKLVNLFFHMKNNFFADKKANLTEKGAIAFTKRMAEMTGKTHVDAPTRADAIASTNFTEDYF
jgi:hypothetical protein